MLRLLAVALAVGVVLPGGLARGGLIQGTPTFVLEVTSSQSGDTLTLRPTLTPSQDGTYSTQGSDGATSFSIVWDLSLNPDPSLSGSFTLTNLSGLNQNFTISASMTGVTPLPYPTMSGSYGGIDYTDTNDRDVTVNSAGFYTARIDGSPVKVLGSFDLNANGGDVPGISGQGSPELFGPEAAGRPVSSSIGVSFDFGLTARDILETPFQFLVVPEPGFVFLFAGMGVIFLARALRRSTG